MTTARQIGRFIKERRTALSIGPDDLADIAGVSRRTLFYIEDGSANPSLETLEKILRALGLQIKVVVKDEAEG